MASLIENLRKLGPVRLGALGAVAVAMLIFFAYLTTRITTPPMALLYSDLDLKDSAAVVQKLEAQQIPFEIRAGGAQIFVPAGDVARLRMAMAAEGLPRGGSVGYEIFDKSEGFGVSSFQQNINQLRALEGELARTISALDGVISARVHLVMPKRDVFARDRQEASASIVLRLQRAEQLSRGNIAAILHLVSSAVPGLSPSRISIVDQHSNLLARGGGDAAVAGDAEEIRIQREARLQRAVEDILDRTLGPGKARVEVRADIDFDRVTTSSESYDPNSQVVRSTRNVSEESAESRSDDASVTVANNLPDARKNESQTGEHSKSGRNEETINYEISKTVTSRVREGGILRRLSVAVVVDGDYVVDADGSRTYQPRSAEEMERIAAIVRSAVGYDSERGDHVEVVNLRFNVPEEAPPEAPATILGFERGDIVRLIEAALLALIGLAAILLVVRPAIGRILVPVAAAPAGAGVAALPQPQAQQALPASDAANEAMIDIDQIEGRVKMSSIRKIGEIVDKHPEEALAILRNWMYSDDA